MLLSLIGHLYLSGMWLGVAPRADNKKTCLKENGYAQNMISILDSISYLQSKANENHGFSSKSCIYEN